MHATVSHNFFPLVSYGHEISHALKQEAIREARRIELTPDVVEKERWFVMRRKLTCALQTSEFDPECTDRMVIAWLLWRFNAHAERRLADLARTDIQPCWMRCAPIDVTRIGFFPNHRDLPDHTEVRVPPADGNNSEFMQLMYRESIIYSETEIQHTAHCILAEMLASENLPTRVMLPNSLLPQEIAERCGTSKSRCELIGKLRGVESIRMVEQMFKDNGLQHAFLAVQFAAYVNKTGRSVSIVPECARHAVHFCGQQALIHVSRTDLIVEHRDKWVAVASDVSDMACVGSTLSCISSDPTF